MRQFFCKKFLFDTFRENFEKTFAHKEIATQGGPDNVGDEVKQFHS